jgi:hypothetical protein
MIFFKWLKGLFQSPPPHPKITGKAMVFPEFTPVNGDQIQTYRCHKCRSGWIAIFDRNGQSRTPDILKEMERHNCRKPDWEWDL